jgi:hypothetical protein
MVADTSAAGVGWVGRGDERTDDTDVHPASLHVSRILAKLGVAGRGEAAAVAHRLGRLDKQRPYPHLWPPPRPVERHHLNGAVPRIPRSSALPAQAGRVTV